MVVLLKVFPALVMVPVELKVFTPVCVKVIPALRVTLPDMVIAPLPVIVPVNPVQFIDLAPVFEFCMVQVPVDAASKNTSSEDVGIAAPPAPPDVVAHLVPAVLSQLAVPPTQ